MVNVQTNLKSVNVGTVAAQELIEEYENAKLQVASEEVVRIRKSANGEVAFYIHGNLENYIGFVIDRYSVSLYAGVYEHVPETLKQLLDESKPMVYPKS